MYQCGHIHFSGFTDDAQQRIDSDLFASLCADVEEGSGLVAFQFHGGFIRFDLGEDLPFFDGISNLFMPGGNDTHFHGVAQAGHQHNLFYFGKIDGWSIGGRCGCGRGRCGFGSSRCGRSGCARLIDKGTDVLPGLSDDGQQVVHLKFSAFIRTDMQ